MRKEQQALVKRFAMIDFPFAVAQTSIKKPDAVNIRTMAAALLYFKGSITQVEIAEMLHKTQPSVAGLLKRHLEMMKWEEKYKQKYNYFYNLF